MDSQVLIRKLREQREQWVDLEDKKNGKAVKIRRPSEVRTYALRHGVELADVKEFTVDWRGFTEADILGAGVGASDVLAFDPDLWAEVLADRSDWLAKLAGAVVEACAKRFEERKAALGN